MILNSPCWVYRENDQAVRATILQQRTSEYYVHYDGLDKRLDEWVPVEAVELIHNPPTSQTHHPDLESEGATRGKKRNRTTGPAAGLTPRSDNTLGAPERSATPQEDDTNSLPNHLPPTLGPSLHTLDQTEAAQQHRALTARRNFDRVNFGHWHIKTWYFSPYPSFDDDADTHTRPRATPEGPGAAAGLSSALPTSASSNNPSAAAGAVSGDATLWVCDRCFKYMREGTAWELHKKTCKIIHPPGKKVYQRGAHTIWEVDGQAERLYCQNLSLFGKLFIDVKTLFFDTEHFMFYILTDADAHRDHFLAYFSQEKVSYDDYNLACIVTLPPYQKHGYGMLLIEFSYELSRRAGKLGTPERPLSDLGLRSYVAFWIAVLVRFFRTITPMPSEDEQAHLGSEADTNVNIQPRHPTITESEVDPYSTTAAAPDQALTPNLDVRRSSTVEHGRSPGSRLVDAFGDVSHHQRPDPDNPESVGPLHRDVRCLLEDIANATHLRPDDIALALREAGLLTKCQRGGQEQNRGVREPSTSPTASRPLTTELPVSGDGDPKNNGLVGSEEAPVESQEPKTSGEVQIVITREMVEALARERRVKPPYLDRAYVLL
ncbi:acyl-CoA N-acyltransferase [Ceratobasidium sp. AG-I]|nr:acyl-CoA N-acyltransferase [Ceratobasidium sp. AG-I]